jgi:hypothetical protein
VPIIFKIISTTNPTVNTALARSSALDSDVDKGYRSKERTMVLPKIITVDTAMKNVLLINRVMMLALSLLLIKFEVAIRLNYE